MRDCLEAKPFEPQAELILPTTDAILRFIGTGILKHPEMVGVNTMRVARVRPKSHRYFSDGA
jgi:hypothetical protein